MRPTDERIHNLIENLQNTTDPALDQRILDDCFTELDNHQPPAPAGRPIWSTLMHSKLLKPIAAMIIIAAVFFTMTLSDKAVQPAYAIEQTLEAMENMQTLHLFGNDWGNTKFEMWIKLHPETGFPEYVYTNYLDSGSIAISRPDKSYQYNGNRVLINSGKLYTINIAPAKIFEMILRQSEAISKSENPDATIDFTYEYDSKLDKTLLVFSSDCADESRKIYIDPDTKLPIRIVGLKGMKLGAIFKDIDFMEFNVELPEGIFDFEIPEGTTVIDMDHRSKLINDPKNGLLYDGLSEQETAEQLVIQFWNAVIDSDTDTINRLDPTGAFTRIPVTEIVEVGKLYIQPGCGIGKIMPCKIRLSDGSLKEAKMIIHSKKMNDQKSCIIAGRWSGLSTIPEKPFDLLKNVYSQSEEAVSEYDLSDIAQAIQTAQNIHGSWIDYKGRQAELWGQVDPVTGGLSAIRLQYSDGGLYIIADGKTYFQDDNLAAIREKPYIELDLLFKNFADVAARRAQHQGEMTVSEEFSETFQRDIINVSFNCPRIHLDVVVDAETQRPLQFSIPWSINLTEQLTYTITEYDIDLPENFFDYDSGPDTMTIGSHLDSQFAKDPKFGVVYDANEDLQDVCRTIVSQYLQARIDCDIATIRQLHPIYITRYGSDKMIEKAEIQNWYINGKIVEILNIEQAYEYKNPNRLMVPCRIIKEINGQRQEARVGVPVYFRQNDDVNSVIVIGYCPKLQ